MFRVEWLQTALDQLSSIWIQADSGLRQAITAASHQIDEQLQTDPYASSESRSEGRRVSFSFPLGVLFRVESEERTVAVLRVWLFRQRGHS